MAPRRGPRHLHNSAIKEFVPILRDRRCWRRPSEHPLPASRAREQSVRPNNGKRPPTGRPLLSLRARMAIGCARSPQKEHGPGPMYPHPPHGGSGPLSATDCGCSVGCRTLDSDRPAARLANPFRCWLRFSLKVPAVFGTGGSAAAPTSKASIRNRAHQEEAPGTRYRDHSGLMFAARITLRHFSVSSATNFCRYSGERRSGGTTVTPTAFNRSRTAGVSMVVTVA